MRLGEGGVFGNDCRVCGREIGILPPPIREDKRIVTIQTISHVAPQLSH